MSLKEYFENQTDNVFYFSNRLNQDKKSNNFFKKY